jgi:iron complex transport system ATP-binding protein
MRTLLHRGADRLLEGLVAPGPLPARHPVGEVLLSARGVQVDRGGRTVLAALDLDVRAGEVVVLVGPNGAGKSTALAALAGDLALTSGSIAIDGRALGDWSAVALAQRRAVLPQQVTLTFPFPVEEVVAMGRSPWAGTEADARDEAAVAAGLRDADAEHLLGRPFAALSGGERARVALARVLAQEAQLLLLDEPTASLDLHHQELVLRAVRARAASGSGAVVVLHDLGLAAAHADRIVVLEDGRTAACGPPAEVLSPELLSRVYRHPIEVLAHPRTGAQLVLPERV